MNFLFERIAHGIKWFSGKLYIIVTNMIFFTVSIFVSRDKDVYTIGSTSGYRFADNAMYMFIYLNEFTDKKAIWITRDKAIRDRLRVKGLEAYLVWEPKGIYYQLKSKYCMVDLSSKDVNPYCLINAVKVNLWHGIPIKKLSCYYDKSSKILNSIKASKWYKLFLPGLWDPKDMVVLATSEQVIERMLPSFPVDRRKMIVANYPRNEMNMRYRGYVIHYLGNEIVSLLKCLQLLKNEGYVVLGYFPTFRDWGEDVFFTADYAELSSFLRFLSDNKVVVVTKFHFGVKRKNRQIERTKENMNDFGNVILLDEEDDINSILPDLDLLISDYSGVIFDFLWYEKPIILYPYDLDRYEKERGFSVDYGSFNPGKKVYNICELELEIDRFLTDPHYIDKYLPDIRSIRNETFDTMASCQRIIDYLAKIK